MAPRRHPRHKQFFVISVPIAIIAISVVTVHVWAQPSKPLVFAPSQLLSFAQTNPVRATHSSDSSNFFLAHAAT